MTLRTQAKQMYLWLRALWFWLFVEARHFWLAVVVPIIALLFVLRNNVTEPEIRITGLLLQVLGIGTVALGIRETRKLFGRPDIFTISRDWFHRFPVYGGRVITASMNITEGGDTMHARCSVSANAGTDATTEARVEALEKNVLYIEERINQIQIEMDHKFRKQTQTLEQEQQTRAKEDQALRAKLEATETGGLHISAMGALWLFVGVTMSTASVELTKWITKWLN